MGENDPRAEYNRSHLVTIEPMKQFTPIST